MSASDLFGLDDLGSRPHNLVVVITVFLVLTWTTTFLRVYTRAYMIRNWGWDDWIMMVTLGLFTGVCATFIAICHDETTSVIDPTTEEGVVAAELLIMKLSTYIIVAMGLYLLVSVTLKISLALFFLRVVVKQWQRNLIYTTTAIYTVYGIVFTFLAIFECGNPTNFLIHEVEGSCISFDVLEPLNYIFTGLSTTLDWLYALIPVFVIARTDLPCRQKISAMALLGLGALGSISSIIRIQYIPDLKPGTAFLRNAADIAIWSIIEPGLGMTAVSLATLRPLVERMLEKTRRVLPVPEMTHENGSIRTNVSPGRYIMLDESVTITPKSDGFPAMSDAEYPGSSNAYSPTRSLGLLRNLSLETLA